MQSVPFSQILSQIMIADNILKGRNDYYYRWKYFFILILPYYSKIVSKFLLPGCFGWAGSGHYGADFEHGLAERSEPKVSVVVGFNKKTYLHCS